jgi:hypothetical protein
LAPNHILEPLQTAYKAIEVLSKYHQGTGLPQSCLWTSAGLPREEIEAKVRKSGRGLHLSYGFRSSVATDIANFPSRLRVTLIDGWSITFGITETPTNGESTTRLVYITSQWNESAKQCHVPWHVRLEDVGLTSPSDSVTSTDSAPRLGSTDTCVAQGNPSYT